MRRTSKKTQQDPLMEAISSIKTKHRGNSGASDEIVDIITFCESEEYLNLPNCNLNLWLPQKVILKSFYMGTRANENLNLTKEEWLWLEENKGNEVHGDLVFEKNMEEVIEKLILKEKEKFNFSELHLCIGRRGTKTLLASIISAYEAYKLLSINNGDLYSYYGIPKGEDVYIINVALSQEQAETLFSMIRRRIMDSPWFTNRVSHATAHEIRLLTDEDLRTKEKRKHENFEVKGSISIKCGHSNPDTLRGKSTVLILFDELAFYDESGKTPGSEFYNALEPSTKKFKKFGDGRLVEISSPNTTVGIFYEIFKQAKKTKSILSFQLPTWCMNNDITYDSLQEERDRNIDNFSREYGAQWAKSGIYGNYFDVGLVERCIRDDLSPHTKPIPNMNYYMHVDPAHGGDRYVAVIVGKERYKTFDGRKRIRVVLGNVWIWDPVPGMGLIFKEIDQEMLGICRKYRPIIVTYDQWNSIHSLQFLKRHGIRTMQTAFNRGFKIKIYQNLKDLMSYTPHPELLLYDDQRLILEMKSIKCRPTQRGQSIMPDRHGEVKTDDIVDCLAGAASTATEATKESLPPVGVAYTPFWR